MSDSSFDEQNAKRAAEIVQEIGEISDDLAVWIIAHLITDHRFAGAVFTPKDIRGELDNVTFGYESDREVTDADVERIIKTWEWREGIQAELTTRAYEILDSAIDEVGDSEGWFSGA